MDRKKIIKAISLIILAGIIIFVWQNYREQLNIKQLHAWVNSYGPWGPVVFITIYIAATVFMLPGAILTLAGGLLFGPLFGTVYNLTGAVIGATLAFYFARYIAEDWVADKVSGPLKILKQGAEEEEWKFVAVIRLVPAVPFNIANYALGLTKIHILTYIIGSAIFMLPGCFVYTYIGSLGMDVIKGDSTKLAGRALLAVGGVVILLCIPWIVKRLKNSREK